MKNRMLTLLSGILALALLSGCGSSRETTQFKKNMDEFCNAVSELDTSINNVDADSENAAETVLLYLDQLEEVFQSFSQLDFPKQYDYLEPLADDAYSYMSTAVASYHEVFSDGGYDEQKADYARENSARAFKRVQTILAFLHGKEPE